MPGSDLASSVDTGGLPATCVDANEQLFERRAGVALRVPTSGLSWGCEQLSGRRAGVALRVPASGRSGGCADRHRQPSPTPRRRKRGVGPTRSVPRRESHNGLLRRRVGTANATVYDDGAGYYGRSDSSSVAPAADVTGAPDDFTETLGPTLFGQAHTSASTDDWSSQRVPCSWWEPGGGDG